MKMNFIMTSCGSGKDPHQPSTWKVSEILRRVLMSRGGGGGWGTNQKTSHMG